MSVDSSVPGFTITRDHPFSYVCHRCKRCCYGKRIPLNPYDLIRLAEALQISTGELIANYTENGVAIRADDKGREAPCIFLGPEGCTVHSGRPGACRIYPLGRSSTLNGDERFAYVEPMPGSAGEYGEAGTIAGYLAQQQLAPYFEASAAYMKLFQKLGEAGVFQEGDGADGLPDETDLLDVDAVVARYCQANGRAVPSDPESKMAIHIKAIEEMLPSRTG